MARPSVRRSTYRDSSVLAAGSLVSGLAAYAFIAIGARSVGSDAFAAVSVLWTLWAMSAAVLTFPVQHWAIRTIEADQGEGRVRSTLRSLVAISIVIGVGLGLVSWIFRSTLFGNVEPTFPLLAATIPLGSVLMGLNRGVLAARRRFRSTAAAIAGENLIRAVGALFVSSAGGLGMALVAGFFIGLAWPSSFKLQTSGSEVSGLSPLAFVGGVAGGSLIGQVILTSGPVVLAIVGGSPAQITGLFSALALFRAPYMIGMGVSPRLTAALTRLALDRGAPAIRRLAWQTVAVGAIVAVVAGVFGLTVGPSLLRLVFGEDVVLAGHTTAVVAAASALALCSLFLNLVMLAAERTVAITTGWTIAALAGVAYLITGVGAPVDTVAGAFLVAEIVALGSIASAAVSPRFRPAADRSS